MICKTRSSLTALLLLSLIAGCSKPVNEQTIVGYWQVTPESVEAMLRQQAGEQAIDEESFGKQIARHFLSKMVVQFSGTELNQYRGGRPGRAMPYTVMSDEDGTIQLNIADQTELSIAATQDSLSFVYPRSEQTTTWTRLSGEQVATLQQQIDQFVNGPATTAETEKRFMWLMNAPIEKAEAYLEKYPDLIQARTPQQQTLLHYAVRFKKEPLVKLVLAAGADVNAQDESKETAVTLCTKFDLNAALLKLLLNAGADIDHKNDRGENAFQDAIGDQDLDKARALLALGAAVDASVAIGEKTPLFVAIEDEQTEIVAMLLANGANIQHTVFDSKNGALYVAARYGTLETIQQLLAAGMDPNAGNAHEWKPINNITFRDKQKIEAIQLLINAGADINQRGAGGTTLLSGAIRSKDTSFAKELIEAGADFEMVASFDETHYEQAQKADLTKLVEFMDQKRSEASVPQ
jgi:ankyrin repeat protein